MRNRYKQFAKLIATFTLMTSSMSYLIYSFNKTYFKVLHSDASNNKTRIDHYDDLNKLKNDAIGLAQENNIIIYSISWFAVSYKYITIAHIIKILEINPLQEIFIYIMEDVFNSWKIDIDKIIQKYQNVKIKIMSNDNIHNESRYHSLEMKAIKDFSQTYGFLSSNKYTFIVDDLNFLIPVISNIGLTNVNYEIFNNFKNGFLTLLKNFSSIYLIPDGTKSIEGWSNKFYEILKINDFGLDSNNYYNSSLKYLSNIKIMNDYELKKHFNSIEKIKTFIVVLMTSHYPKTYEYDLPQFTYYVPSTNMIKDVNYNSSLLWMNRLQNEYFDPYQSYNANFIDLFLSLSQEQKDFYFDIFKIDKNYQNDLNEMNNSTNIVFTGRKFENEKIINEQANKMISLYKLNKNSPNLKVWFKGHPREILDIKTTLINEINKIEPGLNPESWLRTLNHKIPMEIYTALGAFNSDLENNKFIKLYSTFSTYILYLQSANMFHSIEKIIVSENELRDIESLFGPIETSISFPKSKIILDSEFSKY